MSQDHSGNMIPEITFEEHDGGLNAKRTSLVSAPTIYAVVNTVAGGQSSIVLDAGNQYIGLVTVDIGDQNFVRLNGNVTLSDSKGFIGLTTSVIGSSPTLFAVVNTAVAGQSSVVLDTGVKYVGLATVDIGDQNFVRINGNVTLSDSKGYIGLVSVAQPLSTSFAGNVTLDDGSLTGIIGNVTVEQGDTPWVSSLLGNVTLSDSKGFIGLVSISGFANPLPVSSSGNVTLDDGSLTGIIGNVTVEQGDNPWVSSLVGNVTLSDPKGFIGLATIVPTYLSTYTSFATVISSLATIVVPPASQRIVVKDIFISSLGLAEMSIWAARATATINMIPPTSLATTGGFLSNMGDSGQRWPALNDSLTIKSSSTVGVMVNVRFDTI